MNPYSAVKSLNPFKGGMGTFETLKSLVVGLKAGISPEWGLFSKKGFQNMLEYVDPVSHTSGFVSAGAKGYNALSERGKELFDKAGATWEKTFKNISGAINVDFTHIEGGSDVQQVLRGVFHSSIIENKPKAAIKDMLSKQYGLGKDEITAFIEGGKNTPSIISQIKDNQLRITNKTQRTAIGKIITHKNPKVRAMNQKRFMHDYVGNHARIAAFGRSVSQGLVSTAIVGGTLNVATDILHGRSPLKDKYGRRDIPYVPFF